MPMDPKLIAIPLIVLALAAVLSWSVVSARGNWRLRLAVIIAAPLASLLVWAAFPSYMGWPTADVPSGKVLLLWADAREPDPKTGDAGCLYLWAVPIAGDERGMLDALEYPAGAGEPRAYELPYSRRGHEVLMAARERIANGEPMVLEMTGRSTGHQGIRGDASDGLLREGGSDVQRDGDGGEFMVYDLPAASYPDKQE